MNVPKRKTVDPRYAKGGTYGQILSEIESQKVCPFCPETFKWHTKPILRRHGDWLVTENFNPYTNSAHHFLIICKRHMEQFNELTSPDWTDMVFLVNWVIKKYHLKGGGFALRFGETTYTGATVCHLHSHLIIPRVVKGVSKPVSFPIG